MNQFAATKGNQGHIAVTSGTLAVMQSNGATQIFPVGTPSSAASGAVYGYAKGCFTVIPRISNPDCPQGIFEPSGTADAWICKGYAPDVAGGNAWMLEWDGTDIAIYNTNGELASDYMVTSTALALPFQLRYTGTSTITEQDFAFDAEVDDVQTWLGVTDADWRIELDMLGGACSLYDDTDKVAERLGDTATLEIFGDFVPTAYGLATYGSGIQTLTVATSMEPHELTATTEAEDEWNDGNAFKIDVFYGGGSPYARENMSLEIRPNTIALDGGSDWPDNETATIETGVFLPTAAGEWRLSDNRDWIINSTGIIDSGGTVAEIVTSTGGLAGVYESTTHGATTYNGGDPFQCNVGTVTMPQIAGVLYLSITSDSATYDAETVTGPFYAPRLSASTSTAAAIQIAEIDADSEITQTQFGPVAWNLPFFAALVSATTTIP